MQRFHQLDDKLPAFQRHGSIDIECNVIMLCMMHYITNITKLNMAAIYFDKLQNPKIYYHISDSSSL